MEKQKVLSVSHQQCDEKLSTAHIEVKYLMVDILNELTRAEKKHPDWPKDLLHAVAVVNEEAGELTRATLQMIYEGGVSNEIYKEGIQTAAMCIRFLYHMIEKRSANKHLLYVDDKGKEIPEFKPAQQGCPFDEPLNPLSPTIAPKKKTYISGKITGIEKVAAFRFAAAESFLMDIGAEPVNPMKLDHSQHDKSWPSYMRVCIAALVQCDEILMLDNYRNSPGAMLELHIATLLQMPIHYEYKTHNDEQKR